MLNVKMNFGWKAKLAALAALVMTSLPVHAVPLSPGSEVLQTFNLAPNSSETSLFEPTQNLFVSIISVAGAGFPLGDDLALVRFGVNGADTAFETFSANDMTSNAVGSLPSFFASEPFTVDFTATGAERSVGITYTLVTEEVPVVPLPASGMMLGGLLLLGLGGVAARRYLK